MTNVPISAVLEHSFKLAIATTDCNFVGGGFYDIRKEDQEKDVQWKGPYCNSSSFCLIHKKKKVKRKTRKRSLPIIGDHSRSSARYRFMCWSDDGLNLGFSPYKDEQNVLLHVDMHTFNSLTTCYVPRDFYFRKFWHIWVIVILCWNLSRTALKSRKAVAYHYLDYCSYDVFGICIPRLSSLYYHFYSSYLVKCVKPVRIIFCWVL